MLAEGSFDDFVVWDGRADSPAIWKTGSVAFDRADVEPVISGRREVPLASGRSVLCRTVWDAFRAEVDKYPLEEVARITMVPAGEIAKAARFYGKSSPASIQWGVPVDMTPAITPLCQAMAALLGTHGEPRRAGR